MKNGSFPALQFGQADTVPAISFIPVTFSEEINSQTNLAEAIWNSLPHRLQPGDILTVTHKALSKGEGCCVDLRTVTPSERAKELALKHGKDARLAEVILRQSQDIVRAERGIIICRTHHGFVCANAGVDQSNSRPYTVITLPPDPDASAQRLALALERLSGFPVPVIICDSFGRAWRQGIVNVAIGIAGIAPFTDYRGQRDPSGYELRATLMATADAIAAGAELAMGKFNRTPAVIVRGVSWTPGDAGAAAIPYPPDRDLFAGQGQQ
ncbi:coenzyme F420-0:L-glutamate ligase [bacterium]|nr:coenzyme F420-0:L-glutamate ligase [bacterium]